MKKLIVYDGSCPMCRLYTKGMVAADSSGCLTRISSNQLAEEALLNRVDRQRARHEIPLIDLDGGETLYGVDTWTYALGQRNQRIEKLLSFGWLRAILQKLYAFISYNRRIIITSPPGRWRLLDLQPDFRLSYRLAFILLVFGLASMLFSTISGSIWPILVLVAGQLTAAGLYLWLAKTGDFLQTIMDYSGHLGMSLLIGGLIIRVGQTMNWQPFILIGYALLIGQHFIRTYRLGLNPWLSVWFTALVFLLFRPL